VAGLQFPHCRVSSVMKPFPGEVDMFDFLRRLFSGPNTPMVNPFLGDPEMLNRVLDDEQALEAASDVIVRFYAHDQYGREKPRAQRALAKRIPGHPNEVYPKVFDFLSALYDETMVAVKREYPWWKFGMLEISPATYARVLPYLQQKFPGCKSAILETFIGWVIYFHHQS
jgi:hypothetical protein